MMTESLHGEGSFHPYDRLLSHFLKQEKQDLTVIEALLNNDPNSDLNPLEAIQRWRDLLAVNIALSSSGACEGGDVVILRTIGDLRATPLWPGFQLQEVLEALNCHFAGLPVADILPQQTEGGAALLDCKGYWPWAALPHQLLHAELGFLWALLSVVRGNKELLEASRRLAAWQLNTLDADFLPLPGLFTREADALLSLQLLNNYLLFHSVALLLQDPQFEYAAERQLEHLHVLAPPSIPAVVVILNEWIERQVTKAVIPQPFTLPSQVQDASTGLVGCRSLGTSVAATMAGGGTGLGSYSSGSVHIVTHGPQSLPLGDCLGFGIENISPPNWTLKSESTAWRAEGRARAATAPLHPHSSALFRRGRAATVWLDILQHYSKGVLEIETSFISLTPLDQYAWTFFVQADSCTLEGGRKVRLRSLEQYQGKSEKIELIRKQDKLTITPSAGSQEMFVIPLGGEESFWGADFMIAYRLSASTPKYSFRINSPLHC